MRRRMLFCLLPIFFLLQGSSSFAQTDQKLERYIQLYTLSGGKVLSVNTSWTGFVDKLSQNKYASQKGKAFLQHLYSKTHHRYLKNYEEYATFDELWDGGDYNCLTGTALYALLLDHFGYEYKVIETNYHIFLLAKVGDDQVLLEATDPINGFIDDAREIEKRIGHYKQNIVREVRADKSYYKYSFQLYNAVDLDEMLGLMHYNHAIQAFNNRQLPLVINHLDRATEQYSSPRIEEFSKIVLLSVLESKMENAVKEECVRKIQSMRKRLMPIASVSANY
jgi:hypothetical protein